MFKRLTIAGLDFYRYFVSPLKPPTCRFHPSCSNYARESILRYGLLVGCWRGIKRVARCHPWHPGGYDPVD